VSDRFHVQKLLGEALEEIRIKHRREAIEAENERIKLERRHLIARSKHLRLMHKSKWTEVQIKRAEVLL